MKIKCRKDVLEVTNKDKIVFNGVIYILMTQQISYGIWGHKTNPTVAKTKAKKMIKDGILVECGTVMLGRTKCNCYRFDVEGHEGEVW